MSVLIKGMTAKELLDVFQWARTGANNCMIGHGVVATELLDHGDLIDRDALRTDGLMYRNGVDEDGLIYVPLRDVMKAISNASVVIPAERSEE